MRAIFSNSVYFLYLYRLVNILLIFRLGAACPTNYNPADFFIQLLAVVPNREEACRETIELVCDAFSKSDEGLQLAARTEFYPQFQVR